MNDYRKRKSGSLILWGIISVFTTIFILLNSTVGYQTSHHSSDIVIDIIMQNQNQDDCLELMVRKMAHLIEYAALGIAVMQFAKCVEKDYRKKLYALGLFYVLFVAVLDEHIQSFSDRTSSTGDILLDFFGALTGFAIVLAIHFIYAKLKKKKERRSFVEMVLETEQKEKE